MKRALYLVLLLLLLSLAGKAQTTTDVKPFNEFATAPQPFLFSVNTLTGSHTGA